MQELAPHTHSLTHAIVSVSFIWHCDAAMEWRRKTMRKNSSRKSGLLTEWTNECRTVTATTTAAAATETVLSLFHYIMISVWNFVCPWKKLNFSVKKLAKKEIPLYPYIYIRIRNKMKTVFFCSPFLSFGFPHFSFHFSLRQLSVAAVWRDRERERIVLFICSSSSFIVNQTMNTYELHMAACPRVLSHANSKAWLQHFAFG